MSIPGEGRLRDPVFWAEVLQLAKTALAAVVAWVIAAGVLQLPQPFLAPWSALLVVHATVYRTMSRGVQQVAATVTAVLLATAVGQVIGLDTVAVALVVGVGLFLGLLPWYRAEATTVAATGLVVLTTGFSNDVMLWSRLADTGIGVATGLVVNLLVWPPLAKRTAALAIDDIRSAIGDLLADIARAADTAFTSEEVNRWLEQTREIDGQIDHAWSVVRHARESARMNPRREARGVRDPKRWHEVLHRMEQAVAETRSLAGTLLTASAPRDTWDREFAEYWIPLLGAAGKAISDSDPAAARQVRSQLGTLSRLLSRHREWSPVWPVYGALIVNLRNIVASMDQVAGVNPHE